MIYTGVFSNLTLLFFVQWCTNNATGNIFNLFKGGYHKRYIFTYDKLFKIFDHNTQFEVAKMNPEDLMEEDYFSII